MASIVISKLNFIFWLKILMETGPMPADWVEMGYVGVVSWNLQSNVRGIDRSLVCGNLCNKPRREWGFRRHSGMQWLVKIGAGGSLGVSTEN